MQFAVLDAPYFWPYFEGKRLLERSSFLVRTEGRTVGKEVDRAECLAEEREAFALAITEGKDEHFEDAPGAFFKNAPGAFYKDGHFEGAPGALFK